MEQFTRRSVPLFRIQSRSKLSAVSREPFPLTFVRERVFLRNPGTVNHVGVANLSEKVRLMLKFYAVMETVLINKSKQCTITSNVLARDVLKTKL